MEQGFVLDMSYGAQRVSEWVRGSPEKSFWTTTKAPAGDRIPIGTFRCTSCGFLESYARPGFAAS
jgi:hypothetical protein